MKKFLLITCILSILVVSVSYLTLNGTITTDFGLSDQTLGIVVMISIAYILYCITYTLVGFLINSLRDK